MGKAMSLGGHLRLRLISRVERLTEIVSGFACHTSRFTGGLKVEGS